MSLITIFGGSGFLGHYTVKHLAEAGHRIRIAVRNPNLAEYLRVCGSIGQIEVVQANIRDEQSCKKAIQGSDTVINLVGILRETKKQTFKIPKLRLTQKN